MDDNLLAFDNNIKNLPSTIYEETDLDNIIESQVGGADKKLDT